MPTVVFVHFTLDVGKRTLLAHGVPIDLQSRSLDILVYLIAERHRVVSREDIVTAVWAGRAVAPNNLTVQISLLRRILAEHGGEGLIVTVPGRGYQFAGEVAGQAAETAPVPRWPGFFAARWRALATVAGVSGVALGCAFALHPAPVRFAVHVQVETKPDEIAIPPDGYCRVDYEFRVVDPVEMQLDTEDVQYYLTSGEPVGSPSIRGRIYHGSFPISGRGKGVYHNNIYLPMSVVTAARLNGHEDAYLRHMFHLTDPQGNEVSVPAVLHVVFATPGQACTALK